MTADVTARGITRADVEELARRLEALPAKTASMQVLTKREAVRQLRTQVVDLIRKKNYTMAEVQKLLRESGVDVGVHTLRRYVGPLERRRNTKERSNAAKEKPPAPAETPKSPVAGGTFRVRPDTIEL